MEEEKRPETGVPQEAVSDTAEAVTDAVQETAEAVSEEAAEQPADPADAQKSEEEKPDDEEYTPKDFANDALDLIGSVLASIFVVIILFAYVFCIADVEGESMLLLLDDKGICASSGSACTSGSLDPSHVLLAIGRPHEVAHGSLRLTLDASNTEEDVQAILKAVPEVVEYLRNMSPLWKDKVSGRKQFVI